MDKEPRLNEKITDDFREYVRMRADALKLELVGDLSTFFGGAIALIIMLLLFMLALMLFTGGLVYALSLLIGSVVWSAVIIGVVYVIVGIVLFIKRRFIASMMVGTFSRLFFKDRKKKVGHDTQE